LLVNAIKLMPMQAAKNILTGGNNAATPYFRRKASAPLNEKFGPIVKNAITKVKLADEYEAFAGKVTSFGLIKQQDMGFETMSRKRRLITTYFMITEKEKAIRKNPIAATGNPAKN